MALFESMHLGVRPQFDYCTAHISGSRMRMRLISCLVLVLLIASCNNTTPDVAPVSGRITLDGKPVEFANVTFQPEGKSPGVGKSNKDGYYELIYKRGVVGGPVGQNTVRVTLDTELAHRPNNIPARYNVDSQLQREIKPGKNEIDLELTTQEKK
jgi:hypothetical protein